MLTTLTTLTMLTMLYTRDGHTTTITSNRSEVLNPITSDPIDAARANEIGLAGWVVPKDELLAEARWLADRLPQGAPLAVWAIKGMACRRPRLRWRDAVLRGETMRRPMPAAEDAAAGLAPAREGRTPEWRER
jgi:enoyl-CoA hydratase/carnithine racemase